MKLPARLKRHEEGKYLTSVLHIPSQTASIAKANNSATTIGIESGAARNVTYGISGLETDELGDGGAGEDVLVYFMRAWNDDQTTGYIQIYEDVNVNKSMQGNKGTGSQLGEQSAGQPQLYFDAATAVNVSYNYIGLENAWLDLGEYPHNDEATSNGNGMKVKYENNQNTNIPNLTDGTTYYLRKRTNSTFYVYTNQANAMSGQLSGDTPTGYITFSATGSGTHCFKMFDDDFRTFQAALSFADISGDASPIAKFEWVFPHPLLLRNGFAVRTSTGVNLSMGYRNIRQSSPVGPARNSGVAPTEGENAEGLKKGQGEVILRAGLNYGGGTKQFTTTKTEVWGIQALNTSENQNVEVRIYDVNRTLSQTGAVSNSLTKATFKLSRTLVGDAERSSAMLGPLNFDPPLLCKDGLALLAEKSSVSGDGGSQVMILYREIL